MSKCPVCGYWAWNGEECFDCHVRRVTDQQLTVKGKES